MSIDTEFQEVIQAQGIYRPAFPSYRVFVYGYEVTGDVVEVRVQQSGGSAERSAGGCSFTLVNKFDKYVITHNDMKIIGTHRSNYKQQLDSKIKQSVSDSTYAFSSEYEILQQVSENYGATLADQNAASLSNSYEALSQLARSDSGIDYENSVVPLFVKSEVVSRKQSFSQSVKKSGDSSLVQYEARVIWDYPYQEGDCIFHFNDPVRIVFRDPFNPQIWYWEFAGFVDSFTEDSGTNKESFVRISCTDVSKIPRYSLIQGTGYLGDESLASTNVDKVGIVPYKEVFAGLTVHEILENMFFGVDSYLGSITPFVAAQVAGMGVEELTDYLVRVVQVSPAELKQIITGSSTDLEGARKIVRDHEINYKMSQVEGRKISGIEGPRGVKFRRNNDQFGVTAYFFGELDVADKAVGKKISNLYEWNNILHHQVRAVDLFNMSKDGKSPISASQTSDVSTIISTIGMDIDTFPVGGGRVFYFAPSRLGSKLGRDALDRGVSGGVSDHSPFVDRLTLLYDLAERMDFRFYATPKGDLVFEMPFYDFDPLSFVKPGEIDLMNLDRDTELTRLIDRYDEVYKTGYTGNYDVAVAQQLTSLALRAEEVANDFYVGKFPEVLAEAFVIEPYEQISFSHTATDEGVLTVARCQPRLFVGNETLDVNRTYRTVKIDELIPTLGVRVYDDNVSGFVDTYEGAELWAALMLNRSNAEMRNVGIQTTPKFNLMVNRPVFWRARNFYGNIVSLSHSIVWNSGCETTINLNQMRGWCGEQDDSGRPVHRHFSNSRRPYDLANLLAQNSQAKKAGGGN